MQDHIQLPRADIGWGETLEFESRSKAEPPRFRLPAPSASTPEILDELAKAARPCSWE
ncbi:hypothetical protein FRC03_001707, partial [Tulasnella sp. 419]